MAGCVLGGGVAGVGGPLFIGGRRLFFQLLSSSLKLCTYNNIFLLLPDDPV